MSARYILLITCWLFSASGAQAFWSSEPETLKDLAAGVATELKEKSGGAKKLYLDRVNVRDAVSGESSNLSAFMVNELESALSQAGFSFSDFMEQADLSIGASYQRDGDKLRIFIKYCPARETAGCKSLAANLSYEKLPKSSFSESLDSRLKQLVNRVSGSRNGLKVFINPVVERKGRYASEFSEYVTARTRSLMVNSQQFEVLEEQPVTRSLSNTRGLAAKAREVKNLETSAAMFSGADAVLDGYYLEGAGRVTVAMTLKNLKGTVLGSAEEHIERAMIPYNTGNAAAGALAEVADVAGQGKQQTVKLNSTKGDRFQIYRLGEKVQFLIQVAKPMYVYLFGINSRNEVAQLYPGPGQQETPLMPGLLHLVPGERDSWEIIVEPPFGTDVVKLFASERPLPLPAISDKVASRSFSAGTRSLVSRKVVQQELAGQTVINGFDLVDYFKGVSARYRLQLYEDSLFIQTRPK